MPIALTRGVKIEVESQYVPEQSKPNQNYYFFSYKITIRNEGAENIQLLNRHWVITNAEGKTEEVSGPGVVGEQPYLEPGEFFQYTSFCPLNTPSGTMHGTYQMINDAGQEFDAEIPLFRLVTESVTYH